MAETEGTPRRGLSEIEIALIDVVKAVLLVLIATHPGAQQPLLTSFAHQRDDKLRLAQPDAAAVFELLRAFAAHPALQAEIAQVRALMAAPPQGRA